MSFVDVVVAREAIYDHDLHVIGYELLFRHIEEPESSSSNGSTSERRGFGHRGIRRQDHRAAERRNTDNHQRASEAGAMNPALLTATALYSSASIGIATLVGDQLAFCGADRSILIGTLALTLPAHQTLLQIKSDVDIDDEVIQGCRRLAMDGFRFVLDDAQHRELTDQLLEVITMAKIDLSVADRDGISALMNRCWDYGIKLVADRVETAEDLKFARELGFDYFQGHALSRPRIVSGRTLETTAVGRMQIAASLIGTEVDLEELENIVRTEPGLIYQLLQLAAVGTRDGTRREVRTVRDALVLVGARRLQSWMALLMLAQPGVTRKEDMVVALTRARMTELLISKHSPWLAGLGFTAGMVSAFDLMLGLQPTEICTLLPLADDLREGAFGDTSAVGQLVRDVIDHQNGELGEPSRSGLSELDFDVASLKALTWTVQATQELQVA